MSLHRIYTVLAVLYQLRIPFIICGLFVDQIHLSLIELNVERTVLSIDTLYRIFSNVTAGFRLVELVLCCVDFA